MIKTQEKESEFLKLLSKYRELKGCFMFNLNLISDRDKELNLMEEKMQNSTNISF